MRKVSVGMWLFVWLAIVATVTAWFLGHAGFGRNPTGLGEEIVALRLLRAERQLSSERTQHRIDIQERNSQISTGLKERLVLESQVEVNYRLYQDALVALPNLTSHLNALRSQHKIEVEKLREQWRNHTDHLGGYHFTYRHQDIVIATPIEIASDTPYTVTWETGLQFDFVDIEFFDGKTWVVIAEGEVNDGKFEWVTPSVFTTKARFYIEGWGTGGNTEAYSKFFAVRK